MKKQKQDKEQQQRKQSEEPIKEELREIPNTPSPPPSVTDKAEEFNGGHPVPDWQANVQTGDNFQKRHLRAVRQGHTLHVIAEKVTENVKTGRSKVTREWYVFASMKHISGNLVLIIAHFQPSTVHAFAPRSGKELWYGVREVCLVNSANSRMITKS